MFKLSGYIWMNSVVVDDDYSQKNQYKLKSVYEILMNSGK